MKSTVVEFLRNLRGGLILVALIFIARLIVASISFAVSCFGFPEDGGVLARIFGSGVELKFSELSGLVALWLLEAIGVALHVYLCFLFLNRRRRALLVFMATLAFDFLATAIYAQLNPGQTMLVPGAGFAFALGILQYLTVSKRAKAFFVR